MDSASLKFIAFGLAAALVSNLSKLPAWRTAVLLASSVVFAGLQVQDPMQLLPMAGFLIAGYLGVTVTASAWKHAAPLSLVVIVVIYMWLKKYPILPQSTFLNQPYFTLGLSYIFFRILHLVVESADSSRKLAAGPLAYLTYTLNFTTFSSGPIQRYPDFAKDQFAAPPIGLDAGVVAAQLERLILGLFKVNAVALVLNMVRVDALARLTRPGDEYTRLFAAFQLSVVYPFFLYANFSGYIDIVIALARLMRVRLPENFDRPFSASSFIDFWNRWHITLSTWLKTYVYNPLLLSLMRKFPYVSLQSAFAVLSFFVTFSLVGVWHGRTSEFLLFGVLQGGGVAVNKIWQLSLTARLGRKGYRNLANTAVYEAFGRGLTFAWFAFTLFWFWANWRQIGAAYTAIGPFQWLAVWTLIFLVAAGALSGWEWLRERLLGLQIAGVPLVTSKYVRAAIAICLALVSLRATALTGQPAPEIVYKAF